TPDPTDIPDQVARLQQAIEGAAHAVVTTQDEIREVADKRGKVFKEINHGRARLVFLEEQLKRLRLLDKFYESDRERLEGVIEASRVLHDMPEGTCPLCNQPLAGIGVDNTSHQAFEEACQREIDKIALLDRDLQAAVTDLTTEDGSLRARLQILSRALE